MNLVLPTPFHPLFIYLHNTTVNNIITLFTHQYYYIAIKSSPFINRNRINGAPPPSVGSTYLWYYYYYHHHLVLYYVGIDSSPQIILAERQAHSRLNVLFTLFLFFAFRSLYSSISRDILMQIIPVLIPPILLI